MHELLKPCQDCYAAQEAGGKRPTCFLTDTAATINFIYSGALTPAKTKEARGKVSTVSQQARHRGCPQAEIIAFRHSITSVDFANQPVFRIVSAPPDPARAYLSEKGATRG